MKGVNRLVTNEGARVLVTGGTRGIGFAVAHQIVRQGGRVMLVGTDAERAQEAAASLAAPGRVFSMGCRIEGNERQSRRLVEAAVESLGELTGVVNAAGGATVGHALDLSWSRWKEDMDTKLWGYFALMRAAVPHLASPGGVIVNILGVAGKDPNPRLAPGTVINGALRGLTKILADDLAPRGIRVLAVNPGATETDLLREMAQGYARLNGVSTDEALAAMRSSGPLGRLPTASDIAAAVVFLMSEEAALITGTSLDIDGGVHRGPA